MLFVFPPIFVADIKTTFVYNFVAPLSFISLWCTEGIERNIFTKREIVILYRHITLNEKTAPCEKTYPLAENFHFNST